MQVFVAPGGTQLSGVMTINLGKLVGGSNLINGFAHPLVSLPLIEAAIDRQNSLIANGEAVDTGNLAANGLGTVDHAGYQTAARPSVDKTQYNILSTAAIGGGPGGRNITTLTFIP